MGGESSDAESKAMRATLIGIAPVAVIAAIPLFLDPDSAQIYSNVANPVTVTLAGALGWLFATRAHAAEAKITSALFSTGLLCWGIAEIFWAYYNSNFPEAELDVSPADGFWLFAYALFIFAAVLALRRYEEHLRLKQALGVVAVWIVVFAVLLVPYLIIVWDSASTTLAAAVFIAYPVLDTALLLPLSLLLLAYRTGRMGRYWLFLILSMTVLMAADLLYGVTQAAGTYRSGDFTDALYIMGYTMFALLFLCLLTFRVRYESAEPVGRYTVMEAFVISPAGNVVASARREGWTGSVDPEVVGAMAGIVRNFAGAAFRDPKAKPLDELSFGPLRLCYEGTDGGWVVVAATRGIPTSDLRERLRVALATANPVGSEDRHALPWADDLVKGFVKD
ncbi:MAG TPA: hypothetical protein VI893_10295 [Thermoplasmata archaeon]|nr:hypothetical protein [Thermoplasmata archaeon]